MSELPKDLLRKSLLKANPALLFKLQHYKLHKQFGNHSYWANLDAPRTFNEHILRRKLDPVFRKLGEIYIDKFRVKTFVEDRIGDEFLIPTLGVYDSTSSFSSSRFRQPCVIKPTHLSGEVIFLPDGYEQLDEERLRTVGRWFRTNHFSRTGEPQYKNLLPRVIIEPIIGDGKQPPPDYKIFCWESQPRMIQVDTNRFQGHQRCFFDLNWQPLEMTLRYPSCAELPARPEKLVEMLEIAQILSTGFDFVRVDLYCTGARIYFGELTFHPDSGNAPFNDYATDLEMGRYFKAL